MSGCMHLHEGDEHVGWVCTGGAKQYISRKHRVGAKKYDVIAHHRSYKAAVLRAAKSLADDSHHFLNRADVIMTQEWYDPIILVEMRK